MRKRAGLLVSISLFASITFLSVPTSFAAVCDGPWTQDPNNPDGCVWTGGSGTYTGGSGGSGGTWTPYDPNSPTYSPGSDPYANTSTTTTTTAATC